MNIGAEHVPAAAFSGVLSATSTAALAQISVLNKEWLFASQNELERRKLAKLHEFIPELLDVEGNLTLLDKTAHITDTSICADALLRVFCALKCYPRRAVDFDALMKIGVFRKADPAEPPQRRREIYDNTMRFFMMATLEPFVAQVSLVRHIMCYWHFKHISNIDTSVFPDIMTQNGFYPTHMLLVVQSLKYRIAKQQDTMPAALKQHFDELIHEMTDTFEASLVTLE